MVGSRLLLAVCVLMLAVPRGAGAENRLGNPGAEDGLTGWGGGVGLASYEADAIPRYPLPFVAPTGTWNLGSRLFSVTEGEAMTQVVDFSDRAAAIDAGGDFFNWGGLLGGRGQTGGARMVVQPLDGGGATVGQSYVVGRPSDRDRMFVTALVTCSSSAPLPVGARAVRARLEADGSGLADVMFVGPGELLYPARPSFSRIADGPGCTSIEPPPAPPPEPPPTLPAQPLPPAPRQAPALRSLVVMPAAERCGKRGPLRFRIHRRWRSSVASVAITARGKRVAGKAGHVFVLKPPAGALRVAFVIEMNDGRVRADTRRFTGCKGLR